MSSVVHAARARRRRGHYTHAAALFFACAAAGCSGRAPDAGPWLAALTAQYPSPIASSPDGAVVVWKSVAPDDVTLVFTRARDGRELQRERLPDGSVGPVAFSPDGEHAALFVDRAGRNRWRLVVVTPRAGQRREIALPPTLTPFVSWSPDGTRLAYFESSRGVAARRLMVVDDVLGRATARPLVDGVDPRAELAWSPDGRTLATVRLERRDAITLVDVATGAARAMVVAPAAEVRQAAWSADGRTLAAVARAAGDEDYGLFVVGSDGVARRRVTPPGDVVDVAAAPAGGWLYTVARGGRSRVHRDDGGALGADDGSARLAAIARDGVWLLHAGERGSPSLVRVGSDGSPAVVIAASRAQPATAAPLALTLTSADGVHVPAYLWRAPLVPGRARAAVVRVHGGPRLTTTRAWDAAIAALNRAGIDVLAVDYRGSTGHGARFEHAPLDVDAAARDVLAACDFLVTDGVAPARIALFGISFGANVALAAAARAPDAAGALVLVSTLPRLGPRHATRLPARLALFHGDADEIAPPDDARRMLATVAGARAARAWQLLPREGHIFHRARSWAAVYAALAEAVR